MQSLDGREQRVEGGRHSIQHDVDR
jgi:hypothetical protein